MTDPHPQMTDPRLEDHMVGLELQLVELVEQQHRAQAQYRPADAARLEPQILAVQLELGASADAALAGDEEISPPGQAEVWAPTVEEVIGREA